MIPRLLKTSLIKSKSSILLLGPRQVGKSTLIKELRPDLSINLSHEPTFLEFSRNPNELENRIDALKGKTRIFIDEVQRLPSLLNTIQSLLDSGKKFQFYLTGSSARKLRRGNANLLPGRIHVYHLGPVVAAELSYKVNSKEWMEFGSLPGILSEPSPTLREKTLRSYAATYLKEEIQAEALTKNLEGFSRFLFVAAERSGQFLDISKLAQAAAVQRQSVLRWFEILEDTLIVNRVGPFAKSANRRLVQHPRYFFFDSGVLNGLLENFRASDDRKGALFKHLISSQLHSSANAHDRSLRLSTYRTESGAEVDFILEQDSQTWAIELKASTTISKSDLRGLRSFQEYYGKKCRLVIFYLGNLRKSIEGIEVYPWQEGLRELGL